MATNTKYKRDAIAIMRDGIKSNYHKASECRICGTDENLEFHHYHTVALLVKNYAAENQLDFSKEDVVLAHREAFYKQYWHELVEHAVTLCRDHHLNLHKVYTKEPPLFTANKQVVWVERQRQKIMGGADHPNLPNNIFNQTTGSTRGEDHSTPKPNKPSSTKLSSNSLLDLRVDAPTLRELIV